MSELETIEPTADSAELEQFQVLVGRQPIFDRNLDVVGYELLYRDSVDRDHAYFDDPDAATTRVMLNAFVEIGLDRIVGQYPAYINLTRAFALGELPLTLPPDRVVLELLESVVVDAPLIAGLKRLQAQGYRIALDDYVYDPEHKELLEIADIIKVDIQTLTRPQVERQIELLRGHRAKIMAEKVETHEEYEFCRDLGFDFFQGYFLCRPNIVRGHRVRPNRIAALRVLAKLQEPDTDVDQLERLMKRDALLGYKLLRLVNSLHFALKQKVDSIRHAVLLLGLTQIKNWLTLLCLCGLREKPEALLSTALVRARMCELIAQAEGLSSYNKFYTVGLFSVLDALLDLPMDKVLEALPLADDVAQALRNYDGSLGTALRCVVAYEKGDWSEVSWLSLDEAAIRNAYVEAIDWVETVNTELQHLT